MAGIKSFFKKLFSRDDESFTDSRYEFVCDMEDSTEPWAMFEVQGIEDSQVKVHFNWNSAFIQYIKALGFDAEDEQDAVQLFFFASQMSPALAEQNITNEDKNED